MDYRHHATDVLAGGLLGFTVSNLSYFLYYPMLTHPESHLPKMPLDSSDRLTSRTFASPGSVAGGGVGGGALGQATELAEPIASRGTGYTGTSKVGGGSGAGGYSRVEADRMSVDNSV